MDYMTWINENWALVVMIINGLIAGWIAGLLLGGGGLIRNLVVGLIGAVVGGYLVSSGLLKLPYDFDAMRTLRQSDRRLDDRRHAGRAGRPLPGRPVGRRSKGMRDRSAAAASAVDCA